MIKYYKGSGIFWFRIFGIGIAGKNVSIHALLFSERHGYTKTFQIFGWSFKWLSNEAT